MDVLWFNCLSLVQILFSFFFVKFIFIIILPCYQRTKENKIQAKDKTETQDVLAYCMVYANFIKRKLKDI